MSFAGTTQVRVTNIFFINMIVVLGLQVTMGNSNVANLGHVTFMGIAAYIAAILVIPVAIKMSILRTAPFGLTHVELSPVLAALIAVAITTAIAFIIGLVITRQSGIAGTIVTLAWLVIVHVVIVNWIDLTRGPRALYGIPVSTNTVWLMFISAGAVIATRLFRDSKSGVQLRASGEDIDAAEAMGVNIRWLRLVAWTLSAAIIAVGGVMYAYLIGSISPKGFYFEATFLTLAMLILGGTIVLFMALRPDGLIGNDEIDEIFERYLGRRRSRIEGGAGRN